MNTLSTIKNDSDHILLYGNERYKYDTNRTMLLSIIGFV